MSMQKGFLSSAALKNTAYITMFIDHFFAVVYRAAIRQHQAAGYETGGMEQVYAAGRAVGRISFILFAYLIVEGFRHTRSRGGYLLRLGIFALVSEIPFDLAFSGQAYAPDSQNIFFTLFLGVLALILWDWAREKARYAVSLGNRGGRGTGMAVRQGLLWVVRAVGLVFCCAAAYCLQTDYKYMGVLLIFAFYLVHDRTLIVQVPVIGCVMLLGTWSANWLRYAGNYSASYLFQFSLREMYGLFAFFWIALYNGQKGRRLPKAFYYGFYPVHLLLLHAVAAGIF